MVGHGKKLLHCCLSHVVHEVEIHMVATIEDFLC